MGNKVGKVQVSALIYVMSYEDKNIFKLFIFGRGQKEDDSDMVLAKFDECFISKKNTIHDKKEQI